MRRWIHPRCIVTLFAIVLLGLALACGPSAPDGPGQEPPVTAEPTATPTPTPTPTRNPMATPTYYPDVISRPVPELDPVLNALIIREAAAQSASGGRSVAQEDRIPLAISLFVDEDIAGIRAFLENNGATINYTSTSSLPAGVTSFQVNGEPLDPPYTWDDGSTLFLADVPASLLPALLQRVEDHRSVAYTGELPYPKLSPELNELVIAYQAGLLPSHDWPEAVVEIDYEGGVKTYDQLVGYLNAYSDIGAMAIEGREGYRSDLPTLEGLVPLGLIAPLSEQPGVQLVRLFMYPIPTSLIDDYLERMAEPDDTAVPEPKSESGRSVSARQSSSTGPTPTPSAGAKAHDVPAWRQAGYKRPDLV